jgi:alkanesulfonate monooxygenase SsuD/methylene tetrahydromethanopterin reductase-like flavin-dependent oxidoreductase (luciferase family)
VRIKGRFWSINGKLYDPPTSSIPLYIAAGGPKSARLAGLYGDGLITSASTLKNDPDVKAAWEEGVREKGGKPGTDAIVVEHWAVVGGEKDARNAANKWRFAPKAWKHGFFDNVSPADIQTRAEEEISLEDVFKDWTVSTDPRVHLDAIEELADLGATHVVIHVAMRNQREMIDFFGRRVIPVLGTG